MREGMDVEASQFQHFSNAGTKRGTQRMLVVWATANPRSAMPI